jgi:hypothetical protein
MRQRSEDREDFAGAFSPERPSLPPPGGPAGPDPGQRRFDRIFAGVAALVVLALIGGLVIYFNTQSHPKPAVVTSDPKKDVEQAYLAYSAALNESLLKLDVGPVAPYLTSNQLKYEQQVIAYDAQQKAQYSAIDEHDLRTVVYSGGVTASVDDNLVEHRTPVIPGTLAHAGPEQLQAFHVSIVLVNQNRHWLIDSEVSFGSTDASSQDGVSYAALSRTKPLDDRSRVPVLRPPTCPTGRSISKPLRRRMRRVFQTCRSIRPSAATQPLFRLTDSQEGPSLGRSSTITA